MIGFKEIYGMKFFRKDESTINTNIRIHEWLQTFITEDMIAVDMTCGQGHDTHFLAGRCKHVYSFDIQQQAISQAQQLCQEQTNITFILDSHINIDKYVVEDVNCVIFNLGYLPGGNKSIITHKESTLIALSKANRKLKVNGVLIITCYPAHAHGKEEAEAVKQFIKHQENYDISLFQYPKKNTPFTYLCVKKALHGR